MAGAAAALGGNSVKRYNSRETAYSWLLMLLSSLSGTLLGYDNGIIGGVSAMEDYQLKFFPGVYRATHAGQGASSSWCKYNNHILQLVVSSLYLAAAAAALITGPFARKYGRKWPLLLSGACFLIGAVLMAAAENTAMLVVGRVMLGFGVGISCLITPMLNAEMAPPHRRGSMNVLFQLFITIGILAAGCINYGTNYIHPWGWRLSVGLAAIPALLVILGGIILPETPVSLLERGKPEQARKVLMRLRGVEDVDDEFADLVEAAHESRLVKHPWRNLMKAEYRPQLVVALHFMMFQQFTGINAIIFFAPILFNSLGSSSTATLLNTLIIGAVNVVSTFVAVMFVDWFGRKALLIEGGIQMIAAEVVVGITLALEFANYGTVLPDNVSVGVLVVICVFIAGFAWSWGPIGWLLPCEIQPLETRAAGSSLNVAINMLFTFVIGQCFVNMLCSMEYGVFFFFAGVVLIMTLFVVLLIPETKNKDLENTFRLFQQHWLWRRCSRIKAVHASALPTSGSPPHKPLPSDDSATDALKLPES